VGIADDVFIGGAINSNGIIISGTTQSTSTTTGALVVSGGVGIGGNLYIGGISNFAGIATFANNTASTNSANGALIVSGGIGIGGNSNFGGTLGITGIVTISNATDSSSVGTGSLLLSGGLSIAKKLYIADTMVSTSATASTSSTTGALRLTGGAGIIGNLYTAGIIVTENTTNSTATSNGAIISSGGLGVASNAYIGGLLRVTSTTASTSTTTGSAVFSGGIGVNNDIYLGGNIVLTNLATVDGVDISVLNTRVTTLESYPRGFGNVIKVDIINGNNTTGERGGLPFATITAANAVAQSGDVILVYPGNYTISATVALASNVSLFGISRESTIVTYASTTSTTLLSVNTNCMVSSIGLRLTSSTANVSLTGIDLTGTSAVSCNLHNIALTIDNSGGSGTGNINGILSNGTGTTTKNYNYTIRNCIIECISNGAGTKRGVYIPGANHLYLKNCEIAMIRVAGLGSYIAAETNNSSAILQLESCLCNGSDADISQTLGTIALANTVLTNATSNNLNFTVLNYGNTLIFSDPGTIGNDNLRYFYPCNNVSTNPIEYRVFKPLIIKNLVVNARVAPGNNNSSTFTIYKNGVVTSLATTLVNTTITNTNSTDAVSYLAGDTYAVTHTGTSNTNISDTIIQIELY
jgi:hypothetical protein